VPMEGRRLDVLGLPLMVTENTEAHRTAFTVSVDARTGISTGISAADRSHTIKTLIANKTKPEDLRKMRQKFIDYLSSRKKAVT